MQFESFTEPMYGIEGVFETYTAGKGITKDSVPLNAMKVKTFLHQEMQTQVILM